MDAGADAIGLNFYPPSKRYVSLSQAAAIAESVSAFVDIVAVVVDPSDSKLQEVVRNVPVTMIQFHGHETAEFCKNAHRPYIKSLRMSEQLDIQAEVEKYLDAKAILIDTFDKQLVGGTGKTFAWDRLPKSVQKPLVLAGGLDPGNAADAVRQVRPYALDVCTGVEIEPGIKDPVKIRSFVRATQAADIA